MAWLKPNARMEQAIARLKEGNRQFCGQTQNPAIFSPALRQRLRASGQSPYAVVVSCSDSRVPPEHVFSAGLGELFVVRTAGHVVDDGAMGSIVYAVTQLDVPLILVMGHEDCGAVKAAIKGAAGDGALSALASRIAIGLHGEADLPHCISIHVGNTVSQLQAQPELGPLIQAGKLFVTGAVYHMDDGTVEFLPVDGAYDPGKDEGLD